MPIPPWFLRFVGLPQPEPELDPADVLQQQWEAELAASYIEAEMCWEDEMSLDGGVFVLVGTPSPGQGCDGHRGPAPVFERGGHWYAVNLVSLGMGGRSDERYYGLKWGQDLRGLRELSQSPWRLDLDVHVSRLARSPFQPGPAFAWDRPYPPSPPEHGPYALQWRAAAALTGGSLVPAEEIGSVEWPGQTDRVPSPLAMLDLWWEEKRIWAAAQSPPD